jgi:hypothetical protein
VGESWSPIFESCFQNDCASRGDDDKGDFRNALPTRSDQTGREVSDRSMQALIISDYFGSKDGWDEELDIHGPSICSAVIAQLPLTLQKPSASSSVVNVLAH